MLGRKAMLIGLLIFILTAAGCGGKEKKPSPSAGEKISIGVSVLDMQRNGNETIKAMMEEQAKKDRAKITWLDAKGDPIQQQRDIQKLIESKVQVAIVQVSDPQQGTELINTLATNNIKVIALESLPYNTPVDAYITTDHSRTGSLQVHYLETLMKQAQQYIQQGQLVLIPQQQQGQGQGEQQGGGQQQGQGQGGQQGGGQQQGQGQGGQQGGGQQQGQGQGQGGQQGGGQQQGQGQGGQQQMIIPAEQQMASILQQGKPVKVLVLQGDPNDQMAMAVTGAVNSGLQGLENVEVVLNQPHPRWDTNLAMGTVQQLIGAGKEFDVVLANDSHLAMAAVEALKQLGRERRVITVGAGADPKSIQALQRGEHDAEVDNRPDLLASLAYQTAKDLAEGKSFAYNSTVANGSYTIPTKVVPPRLIQEQNVYLLQERMKKVGKKDQEQQSGGQGGQQGDQGQGQQSQQQGQSGQQGGQQASGQQQSQGQKQTTLKITTNEGKVVEVQIDGEVQTIESSSGGSQGQQQGGGSQGQGGQGAGMSVGG